MDFFENWKFYDNLIWRPKYYGENSGGFVVWLDVPILRVLGLAELKLSMAMVEIL